MTSFRLLGHDETVYVLADGLEPCFGWLDRHETMEPCDVRLDLASRPTRAAVTSRKRSLLSKR